MYVCSLESSSKLCARIQRALRAMLRSVYACEAFLLYDQTATKQQALDDIPEVAANTDP